MPLGIRATARHEPLDLARKVLRKEPPEAHARRQKWTARCASQPKRNQNATVKHKRLLLPAVLALGLVHGPDDPKWI